MKPERHRGGWGFTGERTGKGGGRTLEKSSHSHQPLVPSPLSQLSGRGVTWTKHSCSRLGTSPPSPSCHPPGKLRLTATRRFSHSLSADVALSPSTIASPRKFNHQSSRHRPPSLPASLRLHPQHRPQAFQSWAQGAGRAWREELGHGSHHTDVDSSLVSPLCAGRSRHLQSVTESPTRHPDALIPGPPHFPSLPSSDVPPLSFSLGLPKPRRVLPRASWNRERSGKTTSGPRAEAPSPKPAGTLRDQH